MAWEFNAFAGLLEPTDGTRLKFAAGADMPADYEIHIVGTGLSFDEATGTFSGTITSFELVDPAFAGAGNVRQSISVAAADQTTLAGSISSFLGSGLGMMADTFNAWDAELTAAGFDHVGDATFAPDGLSMSLELMDVNGTVVGFFAVDGTDLTDLTLSQLGMISRITLQDETGADVPTATPADYTGAERKASAFEYALLSRSLPDPDGGIQGNDETLYPVMVQGDNTITKFDNIDGGYSTFEGGAGTDRYEFGPNSDGGGQADYANATGNVTASLADSSSSGPDGSDNWDASRIGGLGGSNFDDVLTANATFGSAIFGRAGNDQLHGQGGHDFLDGGDGSDDINGGEGDDIIFGGTGNDDIFGGLNAGDNFGNAGDGTDDVIVYLHIGLPPETGGPAEFGEAADSYLGGITVDLLGGGDGTVAGDDLADGIGTDAFEDIEQIWGTMNADTFNADGVTIGAGDIAMFTGMGGADTFTGGAGRDIVNYDNEVFAVSLFQQVLSGATLDGVSVDLSAGLATDMFGDTDTLVGIDDVHGTMFSDSLIGDDFANELVGKEGNDFLDGGLGIDRLFGGLGNDIYVINSASDQLFEQGGIDGVVSSVTKTLATGFENLTLIGTAALNGTGNSAVNILVGNSGINRLTGAAGKDTLTGGAGASVRDIFDFNSVTETGKTANTRDKITDFKHLTDDIDLSTIDANGSAAGNGKFIFLAAKDDAFTGVKGQLHWFQLNPTGTANDKTIIEGDINGDKKADFQIELTGLKVLSAGDFIL
ncbi:MAG: calcium-binding protein [Hyphomicrobiaceae bacterium]